MLCCWPRQAGFLRRWRKLIRTCRYMETWSGKPKISISPNPALVDDCLNITVIGLYPGQDVTLRSRVAEGDHRFYGYAHYQADSDGVVDVAKPSKGGTFTGIRCHQHFHQHKYQCHHLYPCNHCLHALLHHLI